MTEAVTAPTPVTDRPTSVTEVPFEPVVGSHLEHTAEAQQTRWTFAPFDVAAAWTTSWLDYATSALARRSTPLGVLSDAQRFWSVAAARPRPTWSTPFQVAREWPAARLLDFSTSRDSDVVPTVILPPQAGHASTIVDHTPGQSQVRTALDEGLTRLFVLEWLGATQETKDTTVEDYVAILDETVAQVGGRVNLVGDCQGGWLATIFAALRPQAVASLTIGAAPIDFHAGEGAIHDWISVASSSADPMHAYRTLVEANGGVHKGDLQVNGFKMMEPAGSLTRLADLWANIGDDEHVERYLDFTAWFETPQDMAGAFYLWTVEHLFINNELVAGTLQIGGETVDLSRVEVPVYLLAGSTDHITPPEQVWALADHVSTPKSDIDSHFVEAGHLGLFMGRRALKEHWAPLFRSVREKTTAKAAPAKAAPAAKPVSKKAPVAKAAPAAKPVSKKAPVTKTTPAAKPVSKKAPVTKTTPAAKPVSKKAPVAQTAPAKAPVAKTTPPAKPVSKTVPPAQAAPAKQAPVAKTAPAKIASLAKTAPAAKPISKKAPVAKTTPAAKPVSKTVPPAQAAPAKQAPVAKPVSKAAPAKKAPVAETAPVKEAATTAASAPAAPAAKATPTATPVKTKDPVTTAAPAQPITAKAEPTTKAPASKSATAKKAPATQPVSAKTPAKAAPAAKPAPAKRAPATLSRRAAAEDRQSTKPSKG